MANNFNIVLGAKIDTASLTKNINDYFSQHTFKINVGIDASKIQGQIQSAVSSAISKATSGSSTSGGTSSGTSTQSAEGGLLSRTITMTDDSLTTTEKKLKDLHTTITQVSDAEKNVIKITETFTSGLGNATKQADTLNTRLEALLTSGKLTAEQFADFKEQLQGVDLNGDNASAALQNIKTQAEDAAKQFDKYTASVEKLNDRQATMLNNLQYLHDNNKISNEDYSTLATKIQQVDTSVGSASMQLDNLAKDVSAAQSSFASANSETEAFEKKVSSLRGNLEYLSKNGKITNEQFSKLSKQLNNIAENADDADNQFANLRKDISAATSETTKHTNTLKSVDSAYDKVSSRIQDLTNQNLIGKDAAEDFKEQLDKAYSLKDTNPEQAKAEIQKVNQAISDGKKEAMGFGEMLTTAYKKFANHQIATSYRNVC